MNAIQKALDEVSFTIPHELLVEAFKDDTPNWRQAPISLHEQIKNKVIRPRVLFDLNIIGGKMIIVSLEGLAATYSDISTLVYEIPPERLGYRNLISVLSVSYMPLAASYTNMGTGIGTVMPNSTNDIASAGQRVFSSQASIPPISNATVEIIGQNTILIRDKIRTTGVYQLRCHVENENNLGNVNPRSYHVIAMTCILAIKSYIYNKLIVRMGRGYLEGGQELGVFKDTVDSYADAEEMYQTYLKEVTRSVMFMNDIDTYQRFNRIQLNPGI